jgi:hypothetical protein
VSISFARRWGIHCTSVNMFVRSTSFSHRSA